MSKSEKSPIMSLNFFPSLCDWVECCRPGRLDLSSIGLRAMFRSPAISSEDRYCGSISSRTFFKNSVWFSFGAYRLIRAIAEPESEPYTTINLPSGSAWIFVRLNGVP
ncbi:hypothetical protein FKM82_019949 [Ascaphus truei]